MADPTSVPLSDAHTPKPAAIRAFETSLHDIKNEFHKARKRWDEHEPKMFARVQGFTDHELLEGLNMEDDLVQVRTGESAYVISCVAMSNFRYGLHLFGKIKLKKVDDAYIQVRLFVTEKEVKVHCIHKEEDTSHGIFNAIFRQTDPLEWFNE